MNKRVDIKNTQEFNIALNSQQLDEVVEAIMAGKYSWACVLTLRFAGYNPLLYIPYRTYNRLLKENSQLDNSASRTNPSINISNRPAKDNSVSISRKSA